MLFVRRTIHSLQLDRLHTGALPLAQATLSNRLQLLEISYNHGEGCMWLLLDTLENSLPRLILILAALIKENEVNTPQG
jgi:hypothetical protein